MPETRSSTLAQDTINDFGDQWTHFTNNDGFYGSKELFEDICAPLLSADDVRGLRVAEIGSGTGRIVQMLLACGASHVIALEPSEAFDVLERNLAGFGDRVECLRTTGDRLPDSRAVDLVISIGVMHHIPEPGPAVKAAFNAVKPGGRCLVWLYGREGNRLYLSLTTPIRAITTRLPHALVFGFAQFLAAVLQPYVWLSTWFPLPLNKYFAHVFGRMHRSKKVLIIYDQLRPAYARYYRRDEAVELLTAAGFGDVRVHHRHGYSWTVIGTRPN